MIISPLSWVQRPQSFRAQGRPKETLWPNISRAMGADTVRFGNAKKNKNVNETLIATLISHATPFIETYFDNNFTVDANKLQHRAKMHIVSNPIQKVLSLKSPEDKELEDNESPYLLGKELSYKDSLTKEEKILFENRLIGSLVQIQCNFRLREQKLTEGIEKSLQAHAVTYYPTNAHQNVAEDYDELKKQLIKNHVYPDTLSQKAQTRIDNILRSKLAEIRKAALSTLEQTPDVPIISPNSVDEVTMNRILNVATPMIKEYVDENLPLQDSKKQNKQLDVNKVISNACEKVWRLKANPEYQNNTSLKQALSDIQKEWVRGQLKAIATTIQAETLAQEGLNYKHARPLIAASLEKQISQLQKTTTLAALVEQVQSEVHKQLGEQGIHVHGFTQASKKRFDWHLIKLVLEVLNKRDPQRDYQQVGHATRLNTIFIRTDKQIEEELQVKQLKEAEKLVKTGKVKPQIEEDGVEEDTRVRTTITQHILPPAYSVLALPQNDLDLLKRQKPKPNAPEELSRWNDLHDNLGHAFVQYIANRNNVSEVLLEAGQPPQIKSPENPEWHSEANWPPLTLENIQAVHPSKLAAREELANVLTVFPEWLQTGIRQFPQAVLDKLKEIRLAYGRLPIFSTEEQPFNKISTTQKINDEDLLAIKSKIESQGVKFNTNHRATLPEALSRFAIGYYQDKPNEYTISVGQPIAGCYGPLQSLIENTQDNILIVGMAGTGKTSLLRHTLTTLSQNKHVRLIDVDGEVSGGGRVPVNVGNTEVTHVEEPRERRFFGERVLYALRDAVTNRRAHIIARDEVSDYKEATELVEIAKKGARVVTTVHAKDFADLVHNTELSPLVGGRKMSTVGDAKALAEGTGKEQVSRLAPCIFKTIIVLNTDAEGRHVATVIQNPDNLIDKIYKSSTKLA